MKSWISLGVVAVMVWIAISVSDPVFDAAAEDLCMAHAEKSGLILEEAEGRFGPRRHRNWFTPRPPKYWCRFRSPLGETVYLDELDRVMDVTWRSRGLRFLGWLLVVSPVIAVVAVAGFTGLLKRDD